MVPRLHARGTSFKGASAYLFHDKNRADTSERIAWSEAINCWSERPDDAWFEMWDTWKERQALKRAAGVPGGGRDNKSPVQHLSLSWHPEERPSDEQMKTAAREALQVMGLGDHQAVIVAHNDEPHPHVHVLVNTVHRHTGQTAKMTFSKEALSRWAEDKERAAGQIRCEERVKNNARRREIKKERTEERAREAFNAAAKKPFEPVKHRAPTRRQWFDRQAIIDQMKSLRADQKAEHGEERSQLWEQQLQERAALEEVAERKAAAAQKAVGDSFRPQWSTLYRVQKLETKQLARADHLFERAAFVFNHKSRLAVSGLRDTVRLILSPSALKKRLARTHERERKKLSALVNGRQDEASKQVWNGFRADLSNLKARQGVERAALRSHQKTEREQVTFARAKEELMRRADTPTPKPDFNQAASPAPDVDKEKRRERAARDVDAWRRRLRKDDLDRSR